MTIQKHGGWPARLALMAVLLLTTAGAGRLVAQTAASPQKRGTPAAAPVTTTDADQVQQQLMQYLRVSPTLTGVLERDPGLLADQAYIQQNNPELAQFLQAHPEVARDPAFYLFSNFGPGDRGRHLERELWPQRFPPQPAFDWNDFLPFLVFLCVLSALIWMIRFFTENRRWGRIFKVQTEMQGKLLERFESNQELLAFIGSDQGRRALELPPIQSGLESSARAGSPLGRVLTSIEFGIPIGLVGAGLLALRRSLPAAADPLLVFGTLALVLGVGLIVSATVSFLLARHLGLLPEPETLPARRG